MFVRSEQVLDEVNIYACGICRKEESGHEGCPPDDHDMCDICLRMDICEECMTSCDDLLTTQQAGYLSSNMSPFTLDELCADCLPIYKQLTEIILRQREKYSANGDGK